MTQAVNLTTEWQPDKILVVGGDDASTDDTGKRAAAAGAIIHRPAGVTLFDLFQYNFFIIDMITVQ